jgi:hypothetical protein
MGEVGEVIYVILSIKAKELSTRGRNKSKLTSSNYSTKEPSNMHRGREIYYIG